MNAPDAGELPPLFNSIRSNIERVMSGQSASIRHLLAERIVAGLDQAAGGRSSAR